MELLRREIRGDIPEHLCRLALPVICAVSVASDDSRFILLWLCGSSDVAHHALLAWTHSAITGEAWETALSVEAFDLQLAKFDVKVGDKVFKDVSTLSHQFGGLLVRQDLIDVLFRTFEVWEEQYKHFLCVA